MSGQQPQGKPRRGPRTPQPRLLRLLLALHVQHGAEGKGDPLAPHRALPEHGAMQARRILRCGPRRRLRLRNALHFRPHGPTQLARLDGRRLRLLGPAHTRTRDGSNAWAQTHSLRRGLAAHAPLLLVPALPCGEALHGGAQLQLGRRPRPAPGLLPSRMRP